MIARVLSRSPAHPPKTWPMITMTVSSVMNDAACARE